MTNSSVVRFARQTVPVYLLLVAIVLVTSFVSPSFRTAINIDNLVNQLGTLAIVAIGQTFVILEAGIDLSVGAVVSLSTVVMGLMTGNGGIWLPIGLLLTLIIGIAVGVLNGVGVVFLRVPPLIMTLASTAIVGGVALYLMPSPGGIVDEGFANFVDGSIGPIPSLALIILLLYGVGWLLLASTAFGRATFAVGADVGEGEIARRNGVPVRRVQVLGYILSGLAAAIGGIILSARIYSGDPTIGDTFALDSIAAVVLGGTSLFGGIGGVVGTLGGAILLTLLGNVLNMINVPTYYQQIAEGVILVVALVSYRVSQRRA